MLEAGEFDGVLGRFEEEEEEEEARERARERTAVGRTMAADMRLLKWRPCVTCNDLSALGYV